MPSNLKRRVRARMAKTGESYQQALRQLRLLKAEVYELTPEEITESLRAN